MSLCRSVPLRQIPAEAELPEEVLRSRCLCRGRAAKILSLCLGIPSNC